jgi:alpha-tubulin suppressor-like RCC1 family protein
MTPLDVGLSNVVEIAAGYAHSCARRGNGEVWCWGEGIGGQLGDGLKTNSATPVKVSGLSDAVSIVSNWAHTCALRSNGKIACWGNGGTIGDGTADAMLVPKEPPGLLPVTNVTVGWGHTCVVLQGGTAKCWGTYNAWGQLGDGDTKDRLAPVDVVGLVNAASVESGSYHVCALHAGMTVSCWGNAQGGQIGTGAMGDATHPLAEPVPSLSNVDMLHAKGSNTCARVRAPGAAGGDIYCWGGGPIGDGTTEAKPSPTIIPGLGKNVVELAVGENHHCARLATGEIRCWGNNTRRQLSDGSIVNRDTPVAVQGL